MAPDSEVYGRGDLCLVGDVATGVRSGLSSAATSRSRSSILHVSEDDLGAVPDKLVGRNLADATGCTDDDGHLSGQLANQICKAL